MNRDPLDKSAIVLGIGGLVCPVFTFVTSSNNNFVKVEGPALLVFPLLGLVALAGGFTGRRPLVVVAGVAYLLAAVVQLAQFGRDTNWLEGNGSTFALLMALGIGLVVVGLSKPLPPAPEGKGSAAAPR